MNVEQLKFRAWNSEELKYSNSYHSLEAFFAMTDDKGYDEFRTVYQRCTGLQDSEGNDIYEGDILSGKYGDDEVTLEVSYSDEYGAFLLGENAMWKGWLGGMKIIGNIFETPQDSTL